MKKWLPDSLRERTLLVLLLGLMLSHAASMAIHYTDRGHALEVFGGEQMADRIATIASLLEQSTPKERNRVATTLSSETLGIGWEENEPAASTSTGDWRAEMMETLIRDRLSRSASPDLRILYGPAGANQTGSEVLHVSVRLSDQSWVSFQTPLSIPQRFWSLRLVLSMSLMGVAAIALSIWAVRALSRPIATFARAAERLGMDVKASPVPEDGPVEVRSAARVFNEMQQRIRRFIDDRLQMVAAISHDLRTPITRLRLRAEFIAEPEQRQKMLKDLNEMEAMISATLDFAREDAGEEPRETVDLASLVQTICDDFSDLGYDITFPRHERVRYSCQPGAMRRALSNVIENAVKYGDRVRVAIAETASQITIQVEDDGPGIAPDEQEKVFAPFYRVEKSRSRETGGVGLGLTVARTIVRAHGGEVWLKRADSGGLRVELAFPRS
jgi:signal transduction histidine kinase